MSIPKFSILLSDSVVICHTNTVFLLFFHGSGMWRVRTVCVVQSVNMRN